MFDVEMMIRRNLRSKPKTLPFDNMNQTHFVTSDDTKSYIETNFQLERIKENKSTVSRRLNIEINTKREWEDFIRSYLNQDGYTVQMVSSKTGFVIKGKELLAIFETYYDGKEIVVMGDIDLVDEFATGVLETFTEVRCTVDWYYATDGNSTKVRLSDINLPVQEMYPWMQTSLGDYYDSFMKSSASILLLIGPPGTGKTTWIKGLLHHTQSNGIVTYDPNILAKDVVFAEFLSGDSNIMVIEDADTFLKSREDGNTLMSRFLNIGSGLISNGNKKLVFSTNLPNTSSVDEALTRPGRCFDVLEFSKLTNTESAKLAEKIGVNLPAGDSHTVAEIFNVIKHKQKSRSMGFV